MPRPLISPSSSTPVQATASLELPVMGQSYTFCVEPGREVPLRRAVSRVDGAMSAIRDEGKIRSRERIAILAAVNLVLEAQTGQALPLDSASTVSIKTLENLLLRLDEALALDGQLL
jgi:cell division protein ZapA